MKKRLITLIALLIIASMMLTGCSIHIFLPIRESTITFESNGGSPVEAIVDKEGAIVHKPTSPTRDGYEFLDWYIDEECTIPYMFTVMPSEDITLYAKWNRIEYNITLHGGGGHGADLTKYIPGKEITLPIDWTRSGYTFAGWYASADYSGNRIDKILKSDTGDKDFYAKWVVAELGSYVVTLNGNGGSGTKLETYSKDKGAVLPDDWTRAGYTFDGWYNNELCQGTKVMTIDKGSQGNRTFYAKWIANNYTITFESNGGSNVAPITAPYESKILAPANPTCGTKLFVGWFSDKAFENAFVFDKMPLGNITLYAKWIDGYKITYVSDGKVVEAVDCVEATSRLISPITYSFNKPDYYFDGWYFDSEFRMPCGGTVTPTKSITVYAKWTHRSFMPYINKFERAGTESNPIKIASRREFISFFDYMMFDDVHNEFTFKLEYTNGSANVTKEIEEISNLSTNYVAPGISYSVAHDGSWGKIILDVNRQLDKFKPVSNQASGVEDKMYNGLRAVYPETRSASFDDFKYKNSTYSLNVTNSDQLYYALQYGIQPVPKAGSSAALMMEKAKIILRKICDDSMTDLEKTYAIFSWFIDNVYYDHTAANMAGVEGNITKYDAWHVEGVFNNHVAVCDGIAKAFTVLAGIEGIPCIRNTSKPTREVEGHAWNKVYIDVDGNGVREWYNVDATWGNTLVNFNNSFSAEVANGEHFLFKDNDKFAKPRKAENHLDIVANTTSKAFEYVTFKHELKEYNMVIDGSAEMEVLVRYLHNQINRASFNHSYITLTIAYDKSVYANNSSFDKSFASKVSKVNGERLSDKDLGSISTITNYRTVLYVIKIKDSFL